MLKTFAAAAGLAFAAAPALANDAADNCRAYIAQNGGDDSGCDCLGAAADKDATLAEALTQIKTPEDLGAADDQTKAAIAACYPDSDSTAS